MFFRLKEDKKYVLTALREQKWRSERLNKSVKMFRPIDRTESDVFIDGKKFKNVKTDRSKKKGCLIHGKKF